MTWKKPIPNFCSAFLSILSHLILASIEKLSAVFAGAPSKSKPSFICSYYSVVIFITNFFCHLSSFLGPLLLQLSIVKRSSTKQTNNENAKYPPGNHDFNENDVCT